MSWTDHGSTGTAYECSNCGAHVSRGFVRVYGNNDGEVHGCLSCRTTRDLRRGTQISAGADDREFV